MKAYCFLLAVLMAGCGTPVVYDRAGDEAVYDLASQTREVVADGDAGRLSAARSRNFLHQSKAMVGALRARSQVSPISEYAHQQLDVLDVQYAALLDRKRTLRSSSSKELLLALATLQKMHPFTAGRTDPDAPAPAPVASNDDSAFCDVDEKFKRKDCDWKHKHDRDGRCDKDDRKHKDKDKDDKEKCEKDDKDDKKDKDDDHKHR
jgi:hypothetical protein